MAKIIVFAPHADDAELGLGGFIAKSVKAGDDVMVVIATVGDVKFLHLGHHVGEAERLSELRASMRVLGVEKYKVLTYGHDSNLHLFAQGQMVKMLDEIQAEFQPDTVLIPLPSAHQDHRYCWEVGIASTRPSLSKDFITFVGAYEYPLSSWGEGSHANSFQGGMYVDISEHMDTKLRALSEYKSQMRGANALISLDGATALGRLRGIESGFHYAELIHTIRMRMR